MNKDSQLDDAERQLEEDKIFGDLNRLYRTLDDLDERGLVLSLAAFAEEALGLLLRAFLIQGEATNRLIDGFNAPLGTFSARVKMAYALGLIAEDQYADLEHLRKIRNEFAHSWKLISFSEPRIAAHIAALNFSHIDDSYPETAAAKLKSSISSLLVELRSAANQIEIKGKTAKLIGGRLIAGFNGDFAQQTAEILAKLASYDERIANSSGDKRLFFFKALELLKIRLAVLFAPANRDHEYEALMLLDKINQRIAYHADKSISSIR